MKRAESTTREPLRRGVDAFDFGPLVRWRARVAQRILGASSQYARAERRAKEVSKICELPPLNTRGEGGEGNVYVQWQYKHGKENFGGGLSGKRGSRLGTQPSL